MVGAGSTPALLYVLSLFLLSVLFKFVAVGLQIYFQNKEVDMSTLHSMVIVLFLAASNYAMGLSINATGTVTSLT